MWPRVSRVMASGIESELSRDYELCKGCGAIPALRSWKEATKFTVFSQNGAQCTWRFVSAAFPPLHIL